jgi:hypothetical protein
MPSLGYLYTQRPLSQPYKKWLLTNYRVKYTNYRQFYTNYLINYFNGIVYRKIVITNLNNNITPYRLGDYKQ